MQRHKLVWQFPYKSARAVHGYVARKTACAHKPLPPSRVAWCASVCVWVCVIWILCARIMLCVCTPTRVCSLVNINGYIMRWCRREHLIWWCCGVVGFRSNYIINGHPFPASMRTRVLFVRDSRARRANMWQTLHIRAVGDTFIFIYKHTYVIYMVYVVIPLCRERNRMHRIVGMLSQSHKNNFGPRVICSFQWFHFILLPNKISAYMFVANTA